MTSEKLEGQAKKGEIEARSATISLSASGVFQGGDEKEVSTTRTYDLRWGDSELFLILKKKEREGAGEA